MGMEQFKADAGQTAEAAADAALEALLADPENAFLTEHPRNREILDSFDTALDALQFAEGRIATRVERSLLFSKIKTIEGVTLTDVDPQALKLTIESILANQIEIGRGGDAFVVIDKNEIRELPPEICYKFAIEEGTPRGRNTTSEEARLQGVFYDSANELRDSKIGVPMPFYSLEIGSRKVIAMEKLDAKSIDDILHGKGHLPEWLDLDVFFEEISTMLDHFHSSGLFHRDMHVGNIMITQKASIEPGEKWGFIIDFGLSGEGLNEEYAYVKEHAGETFTYGKDHGILLEIKRALSDLRNRERRT